MTKQILESEAAWKARADAEALLSELATRENAVAADMVEDWDAAKYLTDMADYDVAHGISS